jgi:hypothetical protein
MPPSPVQYIIAVEIVEAVKRLKTVETIETMVKTNHLSSSAQCP